MDGQACSYARPPPCTIKSNLLSAFVEQENHRRGLCKIISTVELRERAEDEEGEPTPQLGRSGRPEENEARASDMVACYLIMPLEQTELLGVERSDEEQPPVPVTNVGESPQGSICYPCPREESLLVVTHNRRHRSKCKALFPCEVYYVHVNQDKECRNKADNLRTDGGVHQLAVWAYGKNRPRYLEFHPLSMFAPCMVVHEPPPTTHLLASGGAFTIDHQ